MNPRCAFVFQPLLRAVFFSAFLGTLAVRAIGAEPNLALTNAGLALWLKADAGLATDENGFVQTWADQSGHKNNAVQTNPVSRPHWIKEAVNGRPALRFDGVTNFLEVAHAASLLAEINLTIFAVVRVDADGHHSIISKAAGALPAPFDLYLDRASGQPRLFTGDGRNYSYLFGNSNVSEGRWTIVSVAVGKTNGVMHLNGAFNGSAALTTDLKDSGGTLRIGTRHDSAYWLKGSLAEILFIRDEVSAAERTKIHHYLGEKYGIDVVLDLSVVERPFVCRYEGQTATFSVSAFASHPVIEYQWQKNGADIPQATNAIYTTPALTFADSGNNYRARVSTPGTNRYVGMVTLMVLPDTEPLTSTTAAFLLRDQSRSEAGSILPPYNSRLWPAGDDPSRNIIQSMAQTSDGVLWVGTPDGVARFDGEQFELIPIGSTNHLTKQPVNALCVGMDGSLWVGTAGRGVFQFQAGKWIEHPMPAGFDTTVLSLFSVRDGSIWIGTRKGLALRKNEKLSLRDDKNDSAPGPEKNSSTEHVRSIAQEAAGDLWIAAGDHLMRLREGAVVADFNLSEFNPTYVRSVLSRRDGSIWLGCNSGLLRLQDGKFTRFASYNGLPDNVVTVVFEDSRDNLWIGTSGGLCRFSDGKFVVETTADGEAYDQILCLLEDRENNLWVGTKNGLYQLRVQQFTTYTTRHGLAHNNVTSICEERDGTMWIGTWGGGLHQLRGGKITIYSSAKNKTMRNDLILATQAAQDGGVWFSADFDGGLYRLKNGQMQRYGFEQGFDPTAVRALLEDSAGRLIMGTARRSVQLLESGRVSKFVLDDSLPSRDVRCLLQGREGRLWIGTEAGLAGKVNENLSVFTSQDGLPDNFILSLYEDEKHDLWIGTAKGLCRMKNGAAGIGSQKPGVTRHTSRISSYPGLFADGLVEILEDDLENLWLASRHGVIRISRNDLDAFDAGSLAAIPSTVFGRSDGMISSVCVGVAKPSALKGRDGRLWFATTKGLAVTDPKLHIGKNEKPPPVVIRKVLADKKGVVTSDKWQVTRNASDPVTRRLSPVTLPPGRGELEFHYTALSYTAPEKNRFKYKLEGLDRDWVEADTRHTAFYNNVPPGNYTFHVIACNNDGVWNSLGANVKLSLQPHYWQTWWYKTLVIIASLSLVGTTVRYATKKRMQLKLERLEQQHAVEKERTRIAQDMHDELGARLTEILLLNDRAQTAETEAVQKEAQSSISEVTRAIGQNLNALVWAVSPRNDSLEKTVMYLWHYVDKFFARTSIQCRFDAPNAWPAISVSSETRHNLFLIVKEATNNIVKHAGATEVSLRISMEHSNLAILIEDNGKGFSVADMAACGNGLLNMEKRVKDIGGHFHLSSAPGGGARICLEIPMRNDAALE